MENTGSYTTIVSTEILAAHLGDPAWVIIDCRFDLQNPEWGLQDYLQGHIPGAIYAHLDRDLSGPKTAETGRHPLPEPDKWSQTLSAWGVEPGKQVIAYDTTGGSYAARLWWMLRWMGHEQVALLDGGFPKWVSEGRPVRSGIETARPGKFRGTLIRRWWSAPADVERLRQDPHNILIDARTGARYRGEQEPIDPVAGHIPGAVNRFHGDNLGPDGTFLEPETLKAQYSALLRDLPAGKAVVYCGSGVTSCHHLVALEMAGLTGARLYAGSWSEWIRDPSRPRALGDPSGSAGV